MTVAYVCNLNVYACVNFEDEIMLRGEECKTWVNLNFFEKNGKIVNCHYNTSCKFVFFFRSWMTKRISPLDSSREI